MIDPAIEQSIVVAYGRVRHDAEWRHRVRKMKRNGFYAGWFDWIRYCTEAR